jgi:hypothetical protein
MTHRSRWRWRRWLVALTLVAGLIAVAAATTLRWWRADAVHARVVRVLSERLDAEVELGALAVNLFPRPRATGQALIIRHKGRHDVPPLISIETFEVRADVLGLWRNRVAWVTLDGLVIAIAPRPEPGEAPDPAPDRDDARAIWERGTREVIVNELIAADASFMVIPRDPEKTPKVWEIHQLRMTGVGIGQAFPFEATLTNAVPPGAIDVEGSFGPWQRAEPGLTPLHGRFTFDEADLGYFRGIGGTLSAHGHFGGSLDRIEVRGETATPDFVVDVAGHAVPLETTYHAIVDGTNGDTILERVDARFLETRLIASGAIVDLEGPKGRQVELDVEIDAGRLEDVMRLAVSTPQPPMRGGLRLEARMVIPPGDATVVDKLRLDGVFDITRARFTDAGVQQQVNNLSRTALGQRGEDGPAPRVGSDFSGRFVLRDGSLRLDALTFDVPGALVELDGHYALRAETLDFRGALYMDAKVSQTAGGFKSILLKVIDPLFRRDGRTVVPLKVSGTRNDPEFGLDIRRALTRK